MRLREWWNIVMTVVCLLASLGLAVLATCVMLGKPLDAYVLRTGIVSSFLASAWMMTTFATDHARKLVSAAGGGE